MKSKTLITPEFMVQDNTSVLNAYVGAIFFTIGLGIGSIPLYSDYVSAFFLVPFGAVFSVVGALAIVSYYRMWHAISKGAVCLHVDVVTDVERRWDGDAHYLVTLQSTGAPLRCRYKDYRELSTGCSCLVCILPKASEPFAIYSLDKYTLDEAVYKKVREC